MQHRLPIGSVVSLTDRKEMLMVIGYNLMVGSENIVYDYAGYFYPTGFLGKDTEIKLFNDDSIELLYHKGLDSDNFIDYLGLLAEEKEKRGEEIVISSFDNYEEL